MPRGTELTDGQIGDGAVWATEHALGWLWRMPVTVTVNLEQSVAIDAVRVHTASGTDADVYLPSQILVFGGDASGRFSFLGASRPEPDEHSSARPSAHRIDVRFKLSQLRQILIIGFGRGPLLVLTEVEAFGSAGKANDLAGELANAEAAQRFAIEYRREVMGRLSAPNPAGPDNAHRWVRYTGADEAEDRTPCTTERIDPWSAEAISPAKQAAAFSPARLVALTGGHDYATWRVTNNSSNSVPVQVAVESPLPVRVLALAHVQALNGRWVPDVVTPFEATTLPPKSAIVLLVEASPQRAGQHDVAVSITCAGEVARESFAMKAIAANPDVRSLHGNLWTYLHGTAHAPVSRAIACDADFLTHYGVTDVVVHPDALTSLDDRSTELLRRYFKAYRNASRILLYMDIKTRRWAFTDMPDQEAAAWLGSWWAIVSEVARIEGVHAELLLYPIDEPRPLDFPEMRRFRNLVHSAGIEAPIYATLERRALSMLPWVDVAQLLRPSQLDTTAAMLAGVRELQSYDTRGDAKLLSPNDYYRRQGWEAYAFALSGVGVWNAWDSTGASNPETGWDPFTGERERDFGMLYAAPDGCAWPSLRLLAWRRGLEENRLLRQCAGKLPGGRLEGEVRAMLSGGDFIAATKIISDMSEQCD